MSLTLTLAALAIPLLLGILAGATRLFADPDGAIGALNRFVLYLAFPILIVVGMVDRDFTLPSNAAFYLIVPSVAGLLTLLLWAGRRLGPGAGTVALTSLFGNTAYIGLPVVEGVLGPEALGLGAMAVALHVTTAMIIGPTLLLAWGEGEHTNALGTAFAKIAKQPLAWAPIVGMALRLLPSGALETGTVLFGPVGRTASPVGLFLIGLFLHTHSRQLKIRTLLPIQVLAKLAVIPGLTIGLVWIAKHWDALTADEGAVLVLLSAVPTAISAFAIAKEFETAVEDVTVAIVVSTILAAGVIPLVASWVAG